MYLYMALTWQRVARQSAAAAAPTTTAQMITDGIYIYSENYIILLILILYIYAAH